MNAETKDQHEKDLKMAADIAVQVSQKGGRAYYVGGFVRDRLRGKDNKDIDIEVHGIEAQELREILRNSGELMELGASFGVFGLKGYDIDIAMPRREEATGRGHRDFDISTDPYLGTEKAALRRDFTINALMQDILTGEIIDHFHGRDDLRQGVIRHVHPEKFQEDPLRVLRAAQFASRFGFTVAEETVRLTGSMDLSALAKERILGELEKALLKSSRPSVFFQTLRTMNQLSFWFPELEDLIGVEQSPVHHPEGDVWNHTMLAVDEAAKLRHLASAPMAFMLSALVHDLGKAVTTEEIGGKIHAIEHETKGIPLADRFLRRLTGETKLISYVLNMVKLHMKPNIMAEQQSKVKSTNRMFDEAVSPEDLILLAKADHLGRPGFTWDPEKDIFLRERLEHYRRIMEQPFVQGSDLIKAGLTPGPEFSELLAYTHRLRLSGADRESALKQAMAYRRQKKKKGESLS